MMNELILVLIPIIIGGLFFWAYRHPTSYNKYTGHMLLIIFFAFFCILIHIETKRMLLNKFLHNDVSEQELHNSISDTNAIFNYLFPITLALIIVVYLLRKLRKILSKEPE